MTALQVLQGRTTTRGGIKRIPRGSSAEREEQDAEFPKTHYMGFPASIEPYVRCRCAVGCRWVGRTASAGVGWTRSWVVLHACSAPGGGANARRCAGIIDVSERASIEPYAVSMCGAGGYSVGSASRLAMHCLCSAWKSLPPPAGNRRKRGCS